MATFTAKRMAGPAAAPTSTPAAVYTVGVGLSAVAKQLILTNTGASAYTVSAYLVPVSGSAGASTTFISSISLAPNSEIIWAADLPMAAGEAIYLVASNSAVTYILSGIEIS